MGFWKRFLPNGGRKDETTVHPTDTRLEIVSEGLTKASSELQDFVSLLRQKYQYPKEGDSDAA